MNLDLGTAKPSSGASASLRRAVLVADPGTGLRWLGWSRGWTGEAEASAAVERLETLSVSRQIADVAGFLRSADGAWLVLRGGLMPDGDPSHRYWREALLLDRPGLERIRANPFRIMPTAPPKSPENLRGVDLPPVTPPSPATAEMDTARIRELRTRPWGRVSWNIETLLAAALDVDHTLITGSAVSLAALELLVLLLPPSIRPEFTFHTYALAEPRQPVPRLVFTQFEDDWLFPETAAFGHRLPATELRITRRARNAASELLGLLDTPDRLAEAHAAYESLSAHVARTELVLVREIETVLSLARMLAVREHGHPGAGIRVLEQELARIGPTDWLSPESAKPEQVRIDVLTGLLLDAFAPGSLGGAVVDVVQSGHDGAAPLLIMRRFLDRHGPDSPETERFAAAFGRLPKAAWPPATTEDGRHLRALIESIAPEPIVPTEPSDDWDTAIPSFADEAAGVQSDPGENAIVPAGDTAEVTWPVAGPFEISPDAPDSEPIESSPDTEVLRSVVAALEAARAAERPVTADGSEPGIHSPLPAERITADAPVTAEMNAATLASLESSLQATPMLSESDLPATDSAKLLDAFFRSVQAERESPVGAAVPAHVEPEVRHAEQARDDAQAPALAEHEARDDAQAPAFAEHEARDDAQAPALAEHEARDDADAPAASPVPSRIDAPLNPEHARFVRPAARADEAAATPAAPATPVVEPTRPVQEPAEPAAPVEMPAIAGPILMPADEVVRKPIGRPRRAIALAATVVGVLVLGFGARAVLDRSNGSTTVSGVVADASEEVDPAPEAEPEPGIVFEERIAHARQLAAGRDWAGVRDAVGVAFASLSGPESFARDSLLANAALQLARANRQNGTERTQLFVSVFEHTALALAAVAPFAPGTDVLRLMQAEACLEGSLDCDSGEVVENLVLAVRSSSAEIRGRANELLTRTPPVGPEAAVLVSNDGATGRL